MRPLRSAWRASHGVRRRRSGTPQDRAHRGMSGARATVRSMQTVAGSPPMRHAPSTRHERLRGAASCAADGFSIRSHAERVARCETDYVTFRKLNSWVRAAMLAAAGLAVAWAGTAWALSSADGVSGVVGAPTGTYRTEFIVGWLYWSAALGGVALNALAGFFRWEPAAVGLVAIVAVLTWGAWVCVQRYVDSGWADGLENLTFLIPAIAGGAGAGLLAGAAMWRRRRC